MKAFLTLVTVVGLMTASFDSSPVYARSGNLEIRASNGKCLAADAGTMWINSGIVLQSSCNKQKNQQWRWDGKMLVNGSGKCLDVDTNTYQDPGPKVQVWDCHGGENQLWDQDGSVLRNHGTGKCLDIHLPDFEDRKESGMVQVWGCHGEANQVWKIRNSLVCFITSEVDVLARVIIEPMRFM